MHFLNVDFFLAPRDSLSSKVTLLDGPRAVKGPESHLCEEESIVAS